MFHFFVVYLQYKRTKQSNNYYFMESTNLKKGDVITINWGPTRRIAIFEKFDTTVGNQDGLWNYLEKESKRMD